MPTPSKATLQIALTAEIPVYMLEGIVYTINELYTSYCWLERKNTLVRSRMGILNLPTKIFYESNGQKLAPLI